MKYNTVGQGFTPADVLPYGCASDFEINRRGDHWSPVCYNH